MSASASPIHDGELQQHPSRAEMPRSSGAPQGQGRLSTLRDLLAATFFLALGIALVLHPYATGREVPGDLGDERFNLSLLEFFYRTLIDALHGQPAKFLDAPFFYPWPRGANFSKTHWGDAEIYALVRALGVGSLASFQAWFVVGFALTYVAAFVSLRKLGRCGGHSAGMNMAQGCGAVGNGRVRCPPSKQWPNLAVKLPYPHRASYAPHRSRRQYRYSQLDLGPEALTLTPKRVR